MIPAPQSHSHALGPGVTGPELLVATSAPLHRPPRSSVQQPLASSHGFYVSPAALHDACVAAGMPEGSDPRQHTKYPYVTGSSVLAIKYKDGVLVACDTLAAYGSTKRYKSVERVKRVNDRVVVAASGEYSDFQHIITLLDELTTDDYRTDDGISMGPAEVYSYLGRVMYNRRNKFDPLWNTLVVAGIEHSGKPFLGMVGMIGTQYTDSHVTTGFANQLARPIFREFHRDDMSEEDALKMMYDALKVCYYRDKQSINKFHVAKVTKEGTSVSEPFTLNMAWDYAKFAEPTRWAVGAW